MANFKRHKPRKQTRHPISNYGRGFNKAEDEPRTLAKGTKRGKVKKSFGIEIIEQWIGTYTLDSFLGRQHKYEVWYATEKARAAGKKAFEKNLGYQFGSGQSPFRGRTLTRKITEINR